MHAGQPSRSAIRRGSVAALTLLSLTLAGCYQNPDPTEWNDAAEKNFIKGCSEEVTAKNGTTTVVKIANTSTCECIVELIKMPETGEQGKYALPWDDLKDYEKKQADAKAGDQPPTVPKQLENAIEDCKPEGPGLG